MARVCTMVDRYQQSWEGKLQLNPESSRTHFLTNLCWFKSLPEGFTRCVLIAHTILIASTLHRRVFSSDLLRKQICHDSCGLDRVEHIHLDERVATASFLKGYLSIAQLILQCCDVKHIKEYRGKRTTRVSEKVCPP